jgi:putative ABC transport system permease protein
MFFITYLRRELRRRLHQAVFIALGLALGVGLVVTVAAASAGVNKAEAGVLGALDGAGTDVTVTGPAPPAAGSATAGNGTSIQAGPTGYEICRNGSCQSAAGHSVQLLDPQYSMVASADVTAVARLHGVSAAAGGLLLSDTTVTFPPNSRQPGSGPALPATGFASVNGVDTRQLALGPFSAATITSGRSFTAAAADVAVVDSGYAASHSLTAGSDISIGVVRFTVIGIAAQPQSGGSPYDVYIPLAAAQALRLSGGSTATGEVNMIYVTAAGAARVPAVQHEIAALLPHDTVTTAASLASQVTTSMAGAADLASDLGRWLAVLVLIAAFGLACLLTMAAVARRSAEFGTLKALGWRTRRIIAQVLGESAVTGVAGAAAGVGLGFAGAAIITAVAPRLSVTVPGSSAAFAQAAGQAAGSGGVVPAPNPATAPHVIAVPPHPSITAGVIVLAVVLAVAGGLLAGAAGSWRIARLRPADALARTA